MRKNIFGLFLAVCSLLVFSACEKEDDVLASDVPQAVLNTFQAKYPNIFPEWERKQDFYVADLFQGGMETTMWISSQGEWTMTEMDFGMNLNLLPQPVLDAFKASTYATWQVDDVDKYERPDRPFYQIEVETAGQADRDLFYNPDGTLIKDAVDNDNNDITPNTKL